MPFLAQTFAAFASQEADSQHLRVGSFFFATLDIWWLCAVFLNHETWKNWSCSIRLEELFADLVGNSGWLAVRRRPPVEEGAATSKDLVWEFQNHDGARRSGSKNCWKLSAIPGHCCLSWKLSVLFLRMVTVVPNLLDANKLCSLLMRHSGATVGGTGEARMAGPLPDHGSLQKPKCRVTHFADARHQRSCQTLQLCSRGVQQEDRRQVSQPYREWCRA